MLYGSLLVRLLSEHSPPQSKTKVNQRLNVLPQLLNVKYWLKLIQTLLPQSLSQSMVAALSISVQDGLGAVDFVNDATKRGALKP